MSPAILNFGSCNIDHVYTVEAFVNPGETLSTNTYDTFPGGKGFNQSIAIREAGGSCTHVGRVGKDGEWLKDLLSSLEINTDFLTVSTEPTGHAIIQINQDGENAIITYGGANHTMTQSEIDFALEKAKGTDLILIQNEIKNVSYIIKSAKKKGLQVAFNAAPINNGVEAYPLVALDLLFLNEIEAKQLSGTTGTAEMIRALSKRFPETKLIITLGEEGSLYHFKGETHKQIAFDVGQIIDTTGAGDAFVGTFLAYFVETGRPREALTTAAKASAKCISRKGATNFPKYV